MPIRKKSDRPEVLVAGAGASGCIAAICLARRGIHVTLVDKNKEPARKIRVTGNGRCNLTNLFQDRNCWYSEGGPVFMEPLGEFGAGELMAFFEDMGVRFHDRQGYVYPRTDQASVIADTLISQISSLPVTFLGETAVTDISRRNREGEKPFLVQAGDKKLSADYVILSCGGLAGPSFGCSGEGYSLARSLGHSLISPAPALTPLPGERKRLKSAAGVRCRAAVCALVEGKEIRREEGEMQFTENTISGIPVFQISRILTRALSEGKRCTLKADFLPELEGEALEKEAAFRMGMDEGLTLQEVFSGLVHPGLLRMVLSDMGLQSEVKKRKVSPEKMGEIIHRLKDCTFPVEKSGGYARAQVTAGGIPLHEIDLATFESRIVPGLYLIGEMLDVDGICGGYNLQWAMTGGYLAARSITERTDL